MPSAFFFSVLYAFAAVAACVAAAVMWRRRDATGARPLALLMLAAGAWAGLDAVELRVSTVAGHRLVSQIQYLAIVATAPSFLYAATALAGRRLRPTPRVLAAVWAIPAVSLGLVWTSAWHGWVWSAIRLPDGTTPFATYEYGPWFWVLAAHSYVLMAVGTAALVRAAARVRGEFRSGLVLLLLAAVLPWLGNIAYNAKLGPWAGVNWLALSLGVSGWLLVWVVLKGALLDMLPRAHSAVIDMMADGVVVVDRRGGILYSNASARDAFGEAVERLAGALGVPTLQETPPTWHGESLLHVGGETRWFDIRVSPVIDRWGEPAGCVIVGRDVTRHKDLEDERERLVDELQEALRKVTSLEGMLPICAQCRNVRDDRGYWSRIEDYISSRTPLEFTHAICPDCMGRLYPEVARSAGRHLERPPRPGGAGRS